MSLWSWLKGRVGGNAQPAAGADSRPAAALPPLPVGSVAAVADALTQAGRIVEQQTALHNTPAMQQAAQAQAAVDEQNKIEKDVASEDVNATRQDLAE